MTQTIDGLLAKYATAKATYDAGVYDPILVGAVGVEAVRLLRASGIGSVALCGGPVTGGCKQYVAYSRVDGTRTYVSRPVRSDLMTAGATLQRPFWRTLQNHVHDHRLDVPEDQVDRAVYACTVAFAAVFDLYKPESRKTPGTFFEVAIGSLLGAITGRPLGKQIAVPGESVQIPTDIVVQGVKATDRCLVVPTKITTRERLVQAWAHQRILDKVFPAGKYRSVLVAMSETQRDGAAGVKDICVPKQLVLFQKYLSRLDGLYYLDPPAAYQRPPVSDVVSVRTIGALLTRDLPELIAPLTQ